MVQLTLRADTLAAIRRNLQSARAELILLRAKVALAEQRALESRQSTASLGKAGEKRNSGSIR